MCACHVVCRTVERLLVAIDEAEDIGAYRRDPEKTARDGQFRLIPCLQPVVDRSTHAKQLKLVRIHVTDVILIVGGEATDRSCRAIGEGTCLALCDGRGKSRRSQENPKKKTRKRLEELGRGKAGATCRSGAPRLCPIGFTTEMDRYNGSGPA